MADQRYTIVRGAQKLKIKILGVSLHGWALRLTKDVENGEFQAGSWMSEYVQDDDAAEFSFGPELTMVFHNESFANNLQKDLADAGIHTEVVKVP
jgi:hypothetical protein